MRDLCIFINIETAETTFGPNSIVMFPTLYRTEGDRTQSWQIRILKQKGKVYLQTTYGYLGGKIRTTAPSEVKPSIKKSALEIAETKAKAQYTKKLRMGYSAQEKHKQTKKKQIKDFQLPMGAYLLQEQKHKIIYPAFIQAKLDGYRGLTTLRNNQVVIVSRNGLPFQHLTAIREQLKSFPLLKKKNLYLDGELYLHGKPLRDLRRIMGRKELITKEQKEMESQIRYCVFDAFSDQETPFDQRYSELKKAFQSWKIKNPKVFLVPTKKVTSYKQIEQEKEKYIREGYEGIIVRNAKGVYRSGKRSQDVFRTKEFKKAIFTIVGALEAKGDDKGTVIWVVKCLKSEKTFQARPIGTREQRREYWKNRNKYIGKKILVKYLELDQVTGCVTRFPVALELI